MIDLDVDDLAHRYASGETVQAIAESVGVSSPTVKGRLRLAGVEPRGRQEAGRSRRKPFDTAGSVRRYAAGESEQAIALSLGVTRAAVRRALTESGVRIRGRGEANALRMAKTSPEDRLALTANAHAAVRGTRQSLEHRVKIALTRELSPSNVGDSELRLRAELESKGVAFVPQKVIGPYNADVALTESRIAVEIFGGQWHAVGRHADRYRQRTDYLIDAGWLPVVVWVTDKWPLTDFASEYVVALHERVCGGEPRGRQEHVIRGNGDLGAVGEFKPDNGAVVLNFNSGNPTRCEDGRFG